MTDIEIAFEYAVRHGRKVHLQMMDTPDDQYILFRPYAILDDLINGREYLGMLERHYSDPNTEYLAWPILLGIKTVKVLEDKFEQEERDTWFKKIDFRRMKLVLEFNSPG
jgi:hypothetical protein